MTIIIVTVIGISSVIVIIIIDVIINIVINIVPNIIIIIMFITINITISIIIITGVDSPKIYTDKSIMIRIVSTVVLVCPS